MSQQESKGSKQFLNNTKYPMLAIDYGTKRVGIAISDSNGVIGSPLQSINRTNKRGLEGLIDDIIEIIERERVKSILLGLPQVFAQEHVAMNDEIKSFAENLKERIDIELCYYDESFSSKKAEELINSSNLPQRKKEGRVDKLSAALFLQDHLDETKRSKQKEK